VLQALRWNARLMRGIGQRQTAGFAGGFQALSEGEKHLEGGESLEL
jgi:hypothetical protein